MRVKPLGSRYDEAPAAGRPRLILASSSPRRRELMRAIGAPFRVVPSRVAEEPCGGEAPARFVRRAAREKGQEVAARFAESYVLSADTVVVVGGRMLGKPRDREDAARMLALLSGREHLVHTAVCLLRRAGGYRAESLETTRVVFRRLAREEILGYLRTGECDDKAGAYAAQGKGHLLIDRIDGSYTNVVGLPMTRVLAMLVRAGVLVVSQGGTRWYRLAGAR